MVSNVTRLLDAQKIEYTLHSYAYNAANHSAVAVAQAIGISPARVFKTLVTQPPVDGDKPLLVVIPSSAELDLKRLARALDVKRIRMASRQDAERWTGLQAGGISPLALINRGFAIYLDGRARQHQRIAVSAGKRGAQVELSVSALIQLTGGRFVDLG